MPLELFANCEQLPVRLGHFLLEHGNLVRGAHAGHDVLALRVDEVFSVEDVFAVGRVAREGHASRARVALVAEHHRLHVDGRPPAGGNVVLLAVDYRPVVHPGVEDGAYRAPELLVNVLREGFARAGLYQRLVAPDKLFEVVHGKVGVHLGPDFRLQNAHGFVERLGFGLVARLHAHYDVAVHLDEAAVAVPREARVARLGGEALDGLVVEAEIEDSVHHAGHGFARAGTHGKQERVALVAENFTHLPLDGGDARPDVGGEGGGILFPVRVKIIADFRSDGESGGYGKADAGHFREVCALAAEEVSHRRVAVGFRAEQIYELPFSGLGGGLGRRLF